MSGIKHLIGEAYQRFYGIGDRLFYKGCDFSTWVTTDEAGFDSKRGNQYQPSDIGSLRRALSQYRIQSDDVLMDIGCGKGKVMSVCARYPFRRVRGLELSPALAEIAEKNFARLGLDKCSVTVGDAVSFTDYDDCSYLFLFNPFPEAVFQKALENIAESLRRCPRRCVLIYMNPVYHEMLLAQTPFRLRHTVKAITFWFSCNCYEYDPDVQS